MNLTNKHAYLAAIDHIEKHENVIYPKNFANMLSEEYCFNNYFGQHIYTHISPEVGGPPLECWYHAASDFTKYDQEMKKFDNLPFTERVNIYVNKLPRPKQANHEMFKVDRLLLDKTTKYWLWEFGYENQGAFTYYVLYSRDKIYICGIDDSMYVYFCKHYDKDLSSGGSTDPEI